MKKKFAPPYAQATARLVEIEAEMNRIGYWSAEPLPESAYDFREAFALDTMAFGQWLQFIFIPHVKSIIEQRGAFPARGADPSCSRTSANGRSCARCH